MRLYVGNLSRDVTEQELAELFAGAGAVTGATLVLDPQTGRSRGFGFVEMASDADGARALERFQGHPLKGRAIAVNEAAPPPVR